MKPGKQEMIQPVRFSLWLLVLLCFLQYFGRNRRNPSLRIQPPYIAHWRWKVTTQEINDAEVVVFAGYKESLRCALFILFHCIVLYCILSISFHFISCYYILRSQQTDLPLGLLLSLYSFRNGDLGYTFGKCVLKKRVCSEALSLT